MKGVNFVSCLEVKPQIDGIKENGLEYWDHRDRKQKKD